MELRTDIKDKRTTNNSRPWVVFLSIFLGRNGNRILYLSLKYLHLIVKGSHKLSLNHILLLLSPSALIIRQFRICFSCIEWIKGLKQQCKRTAFTWIKAVILGCLSVQHALRIKPSVISSLQLKTLFKKLFYLWLLWENITTKCIYTFYILPTEVTRKTIQSIIRPLQTIKLSFHIPSVYLIVFATCCVMVSGFTFYSFVLKDLPNPNQLHTRKQILTTKIYARDGSLLYKIFRNQNRSLVKLDDIPPMVINATIAVEDKDYWTHPGFSLKGIVRAFQKNMEEDEYSQGGSTITQQLVKNALLTSEKTFTRKIKELVLAIEVELLFNKQEILQMYFNEIPYGGVTYGIAEASQHYFGKPIKDLNLAEAALLAGIPTAPTRYSPYGSHPEYALARQHYVLDRMQTDGYITSAQNQEAKKTKLVLQPAHTEITAPHFVMYVKDALVEKYGTRMVEEGGLEVYTSLDPNIQATAENAVKDEVERLIPMHVTNGAVLVTHPQTGEILAMVGSRDYFDTKHDGNVNLTTSLRQPGSSIKPLTYALALQSGYTPVSLIEDSPVSYPDGQETYTPVNYDGKFHGNVTLRTALGSSFNIPAVKLLNRLGVNNLINFGQSMGITTWKDRNRFGLSLTLGGGEVRMTDMAVVYGVFANQGQKVDLHPILRIQTQDGQMLEEFRCNTNFHLLPEVSAAEKNGTTYCQPQSVLSPLIAYQISDMLSDNNARVPAFGPNSLLYIPNHQVAVKTGTTNDKRDNWTIGYTPDYVIVTWVGNNDNSPMGAVASGVTGASPIWNIVTNSILENTNSAVVFNPPNGLIPVQVCADTGMVACNGCRLTRTEYFIPGTQPRTLCNNSIIPTQSIPAPNKDKKSLTDAF